MQGNVGGGATDQAAEDVKKTSASAFGEDLTAEITPLFQATAVYNNLSDTKFETFTATGGGVAATGQEFKSNSGTSVGGYGVIRSNRPLTYRAGTGLRAKWTARFPVTGVANSVQFAGLFNVTDTMAVGYDGDTFSWLHSYGGAVDIRTLTVSASSAGSDCDIEVGGVTTSGITLSGTDTEVSAAEISDALNADSSQSGYYFTQNGSTVVSVSKNAAVVSSSFSASGANITASWAQNGVGAAKTDAHIPRTSWDNNPSWFDPTKGSVFQISLPYLGYGNPRLWMMNPTSGAMELVHTLRWANANTRPLLTNPSLRIGNTAASLGSSGTDLQVFSGSFNASAEGKVEPTIPARAIQSDTSALTTAMGLKTILTIRTVRHFNNLIFAGETLPLKLTAVTDSSKGVTIEVFKNATFTSVQNYSYIEQNESIVEYDESEYSDGSGWTSTTGRQVAAVDIIAGAPGEIDLSELGQYLAPGETLTIAAKLVSSAASDVAVTLDWLED